MLVCGMGLLPARRLIELFERFNSLVRARYELLTLRADSNAGCRLGRAVSACVDGTGAVVVVATVGQRCVGDVHVALAVGGALLRHRFAASVCQGLGLLELGGLGVAWLATGRSDSGLRLHQTKIVLLRGSSWTGRVVRIDRCLRCRCRAAVLHNEVRTQLMPAHVIHWRQLAASAVLCTRGHPACRPRACVRCVHDVREVHPLVAVSVSVLGRVGLRAGYLAHTEPLRVVGAYQHRRFAVARRTGLRAEATCVHGGAAAGLGVADTRLHDVDRPTCLVIALLDVGE